MARKKFLRRVWMRYSKLGKGKRKKQKWRKPKGRDNKMREKQRGYPRTVSIGYGHNKALRGKINGKQPIIVRNIYDLEKVNSNSIAVLGKVGKKKRIEIVKKADERNITIMNADIKKILKLEIKKGVSKNESK